MLCSLFTQFFKFLSLSAVPDLDRPRLPPSPLYVSIEEQKKIAIVCYPIRLFAPGQVEYRGRVWTARCCQNWEFKENDLVRVIHQDNDDLMLTVEPFDPSRNDWN